MGKEKKYIKLSEYAKNNNICYRTAFNHWQKGILDGKQLPTGTILIESDDYDEIKKDGDLKVVTYARVSSSENKNNLNAQSDRLVNYCNAKGYKVFEAVKEIGSGLNDNRKKLERILNDDSIDIIVVEHKDRFARFGINYINQVLEKNNRKIEIINNIESDESDLMQDFVSIITSFTARLYGKRRSKKKTEKIIDELNNQN